MSDLFSFFIDRLVAAGKLSAVAAREVRSQRSMGVPLHEAFAGHDIEAWPSFFEGCFDHAYYPVQPFEGQAPARFTRKELFSYHLLLVPQSDGPPVLVSGGPLDAAVLERLRESVAVGHCYCDPLAIDRALLNIYAAESSIDRSEAVAQDVIDLQGGQWRADINGFLQDFFTQAIARHASDAHVFMSEGAFVIQLRVDGRVVPLWRLPSSLYAAALNRLKLAAGMDITEHYLPQDGRLTVRNGNEVIDVRLATLPTREGEKMVLRFLPQSLRFHSLPALGFSAREAQRLQGFVRQPHGLVIVSGPTNSGKTTTLYTLLEDLSAESLVIYSVEDPIEAILSEVHQVQVESKRGLDFSQALRGVLRQDPDIILVGELRDEVSADMAVRAALSGKLVLTTVHAFDAQSIISRLADFGISRERLALCLLASINQRLVPAPCSLCGGSGWREGTFCSPCQGSGRVGRTVLHECWVPDAEDRMAMRSGKDPYELRQMALEKGFVPLPQRRDARHGKGERVLDVYAEGGL